MVVYYCISLLHWLHLVYIVGFRLRKRRRGTTEIRTADPWHHMNLLMNKLTRPRCPSFRILSMFCISTCFWSNYFFQPFSTFFVHFKPFLVISQLKSTNVSISFWVRAAPNSCSKYTTVYYFKLHKTQSRNIKLSSSFCLDN